MNPLYAKNLIAVSLNAERNEADGTCDVVFQFQGTREVLRAHKATLAAASPVFKQMFYGPFEKR